MLTPLSDWAINVPSVKLEEKQSPNTSVKLEKKHGLTPPSDWDRERCATTSFKWGESTKVLTPPSNWGKNNANTSVKLGEGNRMLPKALEDTYIFLSD